MGCAGGLLLGPACKGKGMVLSAVHAPTAPPLALPSRSKPGPRLAAAAEARGTLAAPALPGGNDDGGSDSEQSLVFD